MRAEAEVLEHSPESGLRQRVAQSGIPQKCRHGVGQGRGVVGFHQDAALAVLDDFPDPADSRCDHRLSARHGLCHHHAERLGTRRQHQERAVAEQARDLLPVLLAREFDIGSEAERCGACLELASKGAVAHEDESDLGMRPSHFREGFEEHVERLLLVVRRYAQNVRARWRHRGAWMESTGIDAVVYRMSLGSGVRKNGNTVGKKGFRRARQPRPSNAG